MSKISRSPERYTFQAEQYIKRCEAEGKEPREDYLNLYKSEIQRDEDNIIDPEWRKDNLEYDLRSSSIIQEKCKDNGYAQNLYAALCNNEFRKNEIVPILTEQTWSCTWRYSGGIVADILEKGDYIDWYCSGISDKTEITDSEFAQMNPQQQEYYADSMKYVAEGRVTEEIKQDLFNLGWIVI